MFQVINYIFDEDISLVSPFEISFQSFFEGAQKTGDVIQELNNLIFTILLAVFNCLPTLEYLWNVLLRIGIFIPYVIHSQYKQYKLEKRIYELTWTLSYHLRKDMFKAVPPQSKTSFRTSSSSIVEQKELRPPVSTVSTSSSAPGRPRRRSILHMGDTPINPRIYKIESTPVLFHGKGEVKSPIVSAMEIIPQRPYAFQADNTSATSGLPNTRYKSDCVSLKNEDGNKNIVNACLVPLNPAKKFKRDTDNDSLTSQYSTSMIRTVVQKPEVSLHHTFTVEYFNVLSRKGAAKCPSRVSQDISTSVGSSIHTKQCVGSNESTASWGQRKSRAEDCERKWQRIIERNNNTRNERLAKLKEMEMQKLQEREKMRKAEMMRRRAVIAKIREQNKKILMEQRGMKMNEIEETNDGIVLPVVRVEPIGSISKQVVAVQEHGTAPTVVDMAGQVPVLRVMQRTVTIEHTTAKISKVDNAGEYGVMETKTLHMSGVETKSADKITYQEVVKENTGQRIPNNAEYYLLPKGGPPNKQLVYVKTRSNQSEIPSEGSFANKSMSEIYHRPVKGYGDVRQVRSNLQKVLNESDGLLKSTPAFSCGDLKQNMKIFGSDSPGLGESGSIPETSVISRPVFQLLGACKQEKFKYDYNQLSANTDQKAKDENLDPEPATDDCYDVEAPPSPTASVGAPPSPTASFGSKSRRPLMKRARRRLQKTLNKSAHPGNQTLHHQGPDSSFMPSIAPRTEHFVQQLVPTTLKLQDAKVTGPKSLLLKKIEVRKRLEERRRAVICQNPIINDLTSAGPEKKDSYGLNLEGSSELTEKSVARTDENKQRRYSLDVNAFRTKQCQSRTAPSTFKKRVTRTLNTSAIAMKKVNSKCMMSQPDQRNAAHRDKDHEERPNPPTPRGSENRTIIAGSNRRKPNTRAVSPGVIHTKNDGTHCRNKVGSPVNRRPQKETVTTRPETSRHVIDAPYNQKVATPESGKETKRQDSGNNLTRPRDNNFTSILVLADEKEEIPPPEELKTETMQEDSQVEEKTESVTAESSKSKRSDFLAFQMDEAGHPVPVTHSKDRKKKFSDRIPQPEKQETRRNTTEVQGRRRSGSILKSPKSSKQSSKNNEHDTINNKEWDKRMKKWEEKRKQLSSGRKPSQITWRKSAPQIHVIYKNPVAIENSYNNENIEDETEATKSPGQNDTSHVNSTTSLEECKGNKCEYRSFPENIAVTNNERLGRKDEQSRSTADVDNKETASSHIRNECTNTKECSDKEEMVRVHSSPNTSSRDDSPLVQAESTESVKLPLKIENLDEKGEIQMFSIKSGSSRIDSVGCTKNIKRTQGNECKSLESFENPLFSKSILSPIQSVSDNNYNDDGAGSHGQLKPLNTKQPNGDSDSVKSKPYHSQLKIMDWTNEPEREGAMKAELPVSCLGLPASNQLQLAEQTEQADSISLESDTQRIQNRIEYTEDSEKENASKKKGHKEQGKGRKNTELIQLESDARNIKNTYLVECPQDLEKVSEAVSKSRSTIRRKSRTSEMASETRTENSVKEGSDCKNDEKFNVAGEPVRKRTSVCRKSKEISVILDKLLTVTKTLKDEHISKEFKKNHSKPLVCDRPNDRTALSAIVCYPEGSSIDDIGALPGEPVFLESAFTRKRVLSPVVVECVASTPAEFYEKSREANDRFLKDRNDDGQKMATRIEWYEDLYNPPISSEELETHQDMEVSYKEVMVDRRGCKSVYPVGYERRSYKVKRYEVHHDASHCYINNKKRRTNELSSYY